MSGHGVIIGAATKLFRICVRLYPRRFRVEYGAEMEALFRHRLIRASGTGSAPLMRELLVAFHDVVAGSVAERFPAARTAREQVMSSTRSPQGIRAFGGFSLDLKLGARMLVKYPGLTLVGGLAMAFAICVGTVIFQVLSIFVSPSLPLPQGDRLVQIRNWDVAANSAEPRALHDFSVWRSTLRSVTELGAWRDVTRNLIVTTGDARPVLVAEITTSAFRVADGTPLMGRVLLEADERLGAPSVAVIGYNVWRTRFGSDPAVLGRSVQLGSEHVAVVGVMREGFAFPIAHDVWTPLRLVTDAHAPRSGPAISVFGLLAPGATLDTAQAELTTVGQRLANEQPATHARLQPQVVPYAMLDAGPSPDDDLGILASICFFAVTLLVLISSNVALLLFARAATRESELTVRTALGASRSRIVAQMFAEALVLGGVAALVGLLAAHVVLQNWGLTFLEVNLGRLPFWYDVSLSPATALFALGLTVLGSAIAGVMPALKVTRGMGSRLKQATPGAGGLQFGGVWTAVIVVQVAVTVAFPAVVYEEQWQLRHVETFDAGFPTEEYLAARIQMDTPTAAGENADAAREARRAAFAGRLEELRRRVAAQPGAAGVTFVDRLPRTARPQDDIELPEDANRKEPVGGSGEPDTPLREATTARIDPSYFDTLETSVLAGRTFGPADLTPGTQVAIVDQGFVDQVLQGRNPIGQQVRFASDRSDPTELPNPWMEIVGVVKELGMGAPTRVRRAAGLYLPSSPERLGRVYMMMHLRADPLTFAPKLGEIATAVDPTLRLSEVQRVDKVLEAPIWFVRFFLRVTVVMTVVALVLSLSGIYAVLSFIVARRRREIGVRVALGADRRRVISAIFRRPLIQVALGVVAGSALITLAGNIKTSMPGLTGELSFGQVAMIGGYGIVMLCVCLLACIGPTRRALGVQPTIALRMD
jgi:putative ABC transport system permease protein